MSDVREPRESTEDSRIVDGPDRGQPFVVGLGASAGGLEALEAFFSNTPPDTGLIYVVVQHLSPDYKSLMVELLSRHTTMPVVRAQDGMQVAPDSVFLIPPKVDMTIVGGRLVLRDHDPNSGIHLPIDIFFRSLAEDCGERAVGIVLSGTGSDGMRGVRTIKDAGGMVMVQDENEAKFDGMPRSAISTGLVDFILPVAQMPSELLSYVRTSIDNGDPSDVKVKTDEENLLRVVDLIRRHTGVDFTHYKPATIVRRLERRMSINQAHTLEQYVQVLERSPRERTVLYKELLIGVTKFFRDTDAFQVIRDEVIPAIFEESSPDEPIRVWGPGCSTGEEAYSLAMTFQDYMNANNIVREVKIFATDIDREAVEFAAAGTYPESIVADVPAQRLARFFTKRGEQYVINRQVREMVVFALQNLAKDPPLTRMDLVTCRNLLIYLQPVLQKKVLSLMAYALKPHGYLFLGPSETVGSVAHLFKTHNSKWKVYRSVSRDRRSVNEALTVTGGRLFGSAVGAGRIGPPVAEEDNVLERVYQDLVTALNLRCLVLDADLKIQHAFGNVGDFVQLRPGRASLDVLRMMPKELVTPLRSALSRTGKERREVVYEGIEIKSLGRRVNIRVRPLSIGRDERKLLIVFFEDAEERLQRPLAEDFSAGQPSEDRISHLEQELQYTKENLQATIEELETSNEELQATNEELLASNEELQSTNEELQSVNEELQTVNGEYQQKIEELTQLNNDVENLLRVTSTGMIFVDEGLRIRKFTPAVTRVVNLLPMDVGRPLYHISTKGADIDLAALAQKVLRSGTAIEDELQTADGTRYITRIVPYLLDGNEPQGVVIHFIDVTRIHQAESWFQTVLDSLQSHVAVLDLNGEIRQVNRAWMLFAEKNQGLVGRCGPGVSYLRVCEEAAAKGDPHALEAKRGIEDVIAGRLTHFQLEYPCHGNGEQRWFMMSVAPLGVPHPGVLVWHLNITCSRLGGGCPEQPRPL